MKKILNRVLLGFLVPFSDFTPDPFLKEANEDYSEQKYEESYLKFASYIFHLGKSGTTQDYYIALMGKSSCMMHLDCKKMFAIERSLFIECMNEDASEDMKILMGDVLENSVYWDFCE